MRRSILLAVLGALTVGACGQGEPTSAPGTPWTKSLTETTCGDWLNVMTDQQRRAFAEAEIALVRAGADTELERENAATFTVESYFSLTDDICTVEGPDFPASWTMDPAFR